ncbi:hypothetical protein PG985_001725 [Apiospora marii]|uniref:uncharacterized protein n=1 Tax=Apiospora marii TaxID=335849 RepID=UPI00312DEDA5
MDKMDKMDTMDKMDDMDNMHEMHRMDLMLQMDKMAKKNQPTEPPKPWTKAMSLQADSRFMNLPVDILRVIDDYLPSTSAAPLRVTCQAALGVFWPKWPLRPHERVELRRRLEKDLGASHYFCSNCYHLHRYSQDRPVRLGWPGASPPCRSCSRPVKQLAAWYFSFHHFQLVMNEHRYGPGLGLPAASVLKAGQLGSWHIQPTVAVLDGQCFVSVRYDLRLDGTRQANWAAIYESGPGLRFCKHIETCRDIWKRQDGKGETGLARAPGAPGLGEKTRLDRQGSCRDCLTDYTFEMAQRPSPRAAGEGETVEIKIVTYLQLGACRDPEDWMWRAFASRERVINRDSPSMFGPCPNAFRLFPPGGVKARWDTGHAVEEITTGLKAITTGPEVDARADAGV